MSAHGSRRLLEWPRLLWLALLALAFAWVEGAVVLYLRRLRYPQGFEFPLVMLDRPLAVAELVRELATLAIVTAAAALAGRTRWGRFGAFCFAFGLWDLAYYGVLKLLLDWPEGWGTWDVLFLIPGIWTGPVAAAAGIAAILAAGGAWIFLRCEAGFWPDLRWRHWLGAALSLAGILMAFLSNHDRVMSGGVPGPFPWALWGAGVVLGLWLLLDLFSRRPPR